MPQRARAGEIDIAIAWLSGGPRQGRIGLGYAALRDATGSTAASTPLLTLAEVDASSSACSTSGAPAPGASANACLRELFARATRDEQAFLVATDARRAAPGGARGPDDRGGRTRRCAAGRATSAARVDACRLDGGRSRARRSPKGAAGLARFAVELFRPVQPMLAQTGRRRRATRSPACRGPASNTSSMARACRCTRRAARCASSRASSTT